MQKDRSHCSTAVCVIQSVTAIDPLLHGTTVSLKTALLRILCCLLLPRDEGYKHHGPHGHKKHHYGDESDDVPVPECDGKPIAGVVRTARFTAWNDKSDALVAMGIKLDGINATVAQDLEPECTAFSHDERIAFVSLQVWGMLSGCRCLK